MILTFTVPTQPLPKQRARVVNGHAYTPPETRGWEQTVASYARVAMFEAQLDIFDTPVKVSLVFHRKGRRPVDLDNLVKAVTDAMNKVVYTDDRLIHELHAAIHYKAKRPGVDVTVMACLDEDRSD